MDKSIMPECYADTLLIETLAPPAGNTGYNHKHSCTAVAKEMQNGKLKDQFALGIIDKDKTVLPYLREFEILASCQSGLNILKHKEKHHYFVQINPALERWILNICSEGKIDIEQYGFMSDLSGLKRHTKSVTSLKDKKLRAIFNAINERSGEIEAVRKLKTWIILLRDKNYNIDIKELKDV